MSASKSGNMIECSCSKLFSRRCLASGSKYLSVNIVWVLGIVVSPPTLVSVACWDEVVFCNVPMLVIKL